MKSKQLQFLIPLFIIFLFSINLTSATAQNISSALRDYQRGRFDRVREALIELRDTEFENPAFLFLTAVVEENGERAFTLYRELNSTDPDNPIFEQVLWRLCQYYYAKELYEECTSNLERFINTFPDSAYRDNAVDLRSSIESYTKEQSEKEPPEVTRPSELFTLQFGAFGTESRAHRLIAYLRDLGVKDIYLSEQNVGQRKLYKVRAGEFSSRGQAVRMREEIKRRYKIRENIIIAQKTNDARQQLHQIFLK